MQNCNKLKGIAKGCDDNNAGSIKQAWIADKLSINDYTLNVDENTVDTIVMETSEYFTQYAFKKNTSSYTENWMGDLQADVHLWAPSVTIGLRRIEVDKRDSIMLLAAGRRDLVVITRDNNDNYRIFGLDDGLNLTAAESGTNDSRSAGTFYTITLSGEERWMGYDIDDTIIPGLLDPGS